MDTTTEITFRERLEARITDPLDALLLGRIFRLNAAALDRLGAGHLAAVHRLRAIIADDWASALEAQRNPIPDVVGSFTQAPFLSIAPDDLVVTGRTVTGDGVEFVFLSARSPTPVGSVPGSGYETTTGARFVSPRA